MISYFVRVFVLVRVGVVIDNTDEQNPEAYALPCLCMHSAPNLCGSAEHVMDWALA